MMLKRTIECISRTMAAALKPVPKRSSAPGRVAVVKKLAVSLTRCTEDSSDRVPVSAIGKPEYLFIKVATKAPRMANGARLAMAMRLTRAPSLTRSMSSQSGIRSID